MAATNSIQNHKSPFLTNLCLEMRKNALLSILFTILNFTGLPLVLHGTKLIEEMNQLEVPPPTEDWMFANSLMIFGALSLIIMLGLLIVLSVKNFAYVCSKPQTDMIYSLPMNHTQRFFSTYLSGLIVWLPSAILSSLLSVYLYQQIPFPYEPSTDAAIFLLIPLLELWIYTMIIFCVNACGRLNGAAIICTVLAFLYPILLFMASCLVLEMQGGGFHEKISYLLISISGPPIYVWEYLIESSTYIDMLDMGSLFLSAAFNTLIYLAGAYLLHRKRDAEAAGTAFPFRGFYGFIQFVLAGFVSALYMIIILDSVDKLSDCIPYFLMGILLAMLTLVIFDFIGDHHLRNMKKRILRYVVFASAATAAVAAFLFTGGFGLSKWIPSADHIQSVSMDHGNIEVPVTDPRIQDALSEAHKKEIAHNQTLLTEEYHDSNCGYCNYEITWLEVTYQTGTNTAIYHITLEHSIAKEVLDAIRKSEAYVEAHCNELELILSSGGWIRNALSYDDGFDSLPQEEINRILAAYRKDLTQKLHLNQDDDAPVYDLNGNTPKGYLRIEIPFSCIHTATILEEIFDLSFTDLDEIYVVDAEYFEKYNTVNDILNEWEDYAPSANWKTLTVRQLKELMPYLRYYNYSNTPRTMLFITPKDQYGSETQFFTLTTDGEKLLETMLS